MVRRHQDELVKVLKRNKARNNYMQYTNSQFNLKITGHLLLIRQWIAIEIQRHVESGPRYSLWYYWSNTIWRQVIENWSLLKSAARSTRKLGINRIAQIVVVTTAIW